MLNSQTISRKQRYIKVFYCVLSAVIIVFTALTWAWWDSPRASLPDGDRASQLNEWHLVFAKIAPCVIMFLFLVFELWIHLADSRIMRDVYMPWVSCRCSLYTLLIFIPATMTIVELIGIFQYKNYWAKD